MSLSEIFSNSIRYPLNDYVKFLIAGILALLAGLTTVSQEFALTDTTVLAVAAIISLIFAIILEGYSLDVIKVGIDNSDEIPGIDIVSNFVNGIKAIVVSIVYLIIPIIIALVLAAVTGAIGASVDHLVASLGIFAVIAIIIFILFAIFQIIALARLAKHNSLGEALSIGEVINDVKSIGILKIIAFIIVTFIIALIAYFIAGLIALIPYVGIVIGTILAGGFVVLFYNKALGLLYAEA